jgi:alkenylglycerophosphocholine hydrolase
MTPSLSLWLVAKPLPVLGMAWWVLRAPRSAYRNRIAVGLLLSAVGDVAIELNFIAGLVAFLFAHVAYTAAFLSDTRRPCWARAVPVAAYAAGFTILLWPRLGALRPAFLAYALAISTMLWRAAALVGHRGAPARREWAALGGAVLFAASDSLIALDRFRAPIPAAAVAIMLLYWAGQLGIAWSARHR